MNWKPFSHFYPHLPPSLQSLGISLYGLAYRHERLGGKFQRYVEEFRQRDRWQPERMREFVNARLRDVLLHAFAEVPYYRAKWAESGIGQAGLERMDAACLPRLPITPKTDLRTHSQTLIAEDVARREKLHPYYTSGSTGTPIKCYFTADGHRRFFAAREARAFGWAGASIRQPRSMIGGRMIVPEADAAPPYYRYNWAEKQVYFSAYHISPGRVHAYVEGFNRYRPEVLTGYAYSHYALGRMMLEQGLKLDYRPKALILSSEKLTRDMKDVIGRAFGARAFEEYGAVEQCVLLTECEHGNLHVNPDFGVVEVVDENGNPVPDGKAGRIVCTGLLNEAQPLIRYDIGDIGVLSKDACLCGRTHLPVIQEIVGRLEDAVVCQDGRELVRFHGIFIDLPHVLEAQVIQESFDLVRVRVLATEGFNEEEQALIRRRISVERLGPVHVEIERVKEIERTEKGKFRAVISRISEEQRRAMSRTTGLGQ